MKRLNYIITIGFALFAQFLATANSIIISPGSWAREKYYYVGVVVALVLAIVVVMRLLSKKRSKKESRKRKEEQDSRMADSGFKMRDMEIYSLAKAFQEKKIKSECISEILKDAVDRFDLILETLEDRKATKLEIYEKIKKARKLANRNLVYTKKALTVKDYVNANHFKKTTELLEGSLGDLNKLGDTVKEAILSIEVSARTVLEILDEVQYRIESKNKASFVDPEGKILRDILDRDSSLEEGFFVKDELLKIKVDEVMSNFGLEEEISLNPDREEIIEIKDFVKKRI